MAGLGKLWSAIIIISRENILKYKTDCLTVSRIYRIMKKYGINDIPLDNSNGILSSMFLNNANVNILSEMIDVICPGNTETPIAVVAEYMELMAMLVDEYVREIDARKKFVIDKGIWKQDERKEDEKLYQVDHYLSMYILLCDNGIEPSELNLFESLIIHESIMVSKIIEGCQSMLSMLSDQKYVGFVKTMKEYIKYANFLDFSLDIYNEIEKMYESSIEKSGSNK